MRIHDAHEFLDAHAGRSVAVAEVGGDGRLEIFSQHVGRAIRVVMHLGADAEQEIVGGLQLLAFGQADEFQLLQFRQRARAVLEKRHPEKVLIIAQAAAAVFDVRLLHRGGVAELRAPRGLVLQPRRDVLVHMAGHAFGHDQFLQLLEQLFVAGEEPRLDQRGLGLHVGVGHLHRVVNAAHGMADFQADVPERIEQAVHHARELWQSPAARDHLAVVQKHEINVAVRIEFRAAVAADGDERERGEFLLGLRGQGVLGGVPEIAQHHVKDRGPRQADGAAAAARAVEQFQPVGFDLEKRLVARQFLLRRLARRQRQPGGGAGFDFFDQILHARRQVGIKPG